ncbi:fumarylacetoacetate hydrolase family protein [Bacillus sp. NTK071]|uniref:fumarylacetoacetate hydrolase family protein n=1 Tax=Bacillus sp. NTK071 TaxID=2802175 RepID=UPI001A8C6335|nr:fumarylacetoacetate hydrolase family protein [Bacillus sp. NTK071]MBN8207788.1 fumarylacetoacetate hydrolase family protein [Bacillus sp. NTK071]
MKFGRFTYNNSIYNGVFEEDVITIIDGNPLTKWSYTDEKVSINDVELLAPLTPRNVIGIGANYVGDKDSLPDKIPEMPVFFLKPATSVIGPNEAVIIPEQLQEVKFESELAVVIGKEAKNIEKEKAFEYVFGYTVGNDVTAPQYFHNDGHWTLGKSFDTFTPLGPVIETELDPYHIHVTATVNGEQKQNSPTKWMIVPIKEMIAYLSTVMTLHPGDVILTGSPTGAHFVKNDDTITCSIKEIGSLSNTFSRKSSLIGVTQQ